MILEKFSIGVGDRFAHQARARLRACQLIANDGTDVLLVGMTRGLNHDVTTENESISFF